MRSRRHARVTPSEKNTVALDTYEPSPSPQLAQQDGRSKRSLRGRSGCLNCRRRRKKCDESKPSCAKCTRLGEDCEWDSGLSFRLSGLDAEHPSMIAGDSVKASVSSLQMVDVTFDAETHRCKEFLNGQELAIADDGADDESPAPIDQAAGAFSWDMDLTGIDQTTAHGYEVSTAFQVHDNLLSPEERPINALTSRSDGTESARQGLKRAHSFGMGDNDAHHQVSFQTPISSIDQPTSIPTITADDQMLAMSLPELEPLDYLTERDAFQGFGDSLWPPMSNEEANAMLDVDHVMAESPDMYAVYYPNATYRELHHTLYNHMVETAKGTGFTRQGTPESAKSQATATERAKANQTSTWEPSQNESPAVSSLPKGMTVRREMELWQNYTDELSLWLDMFDNDRHFQVHLPIIARTSDPVRFSILALSARQIERKDPNKPYTESLGLYQEAIRLIATELESMSTAVIASCVLLCVLEMMSSSPRDWARHLDGCAMLIKAAGINGVVGGMRQAIFWCFARMDMWGGFLSETHPKIPTSLWFLPTGSMSTAISRFKSDFQNYDSYANYSLFLCASVLNVVSSRGTPAERGSSYAARWKALFDLLEDWHTNRPPEMRPLTPTSTTKDTSDSPFPIILYTNASAVSANQLYHTATLLMLQAKPTDVKIRGQRSIFWHARHVVGISVCNHAHSAYTNALQPLWFAGKVMSSKAEHGVVLDTLARIERETGFATQWRAQDLKEYWGDEAD